MCPIEMQIHNFIKIQTLTEKEKSQQEMQQKKPTIVTLCRSKV